MSTLSPEHERGAYDGLDEKDDNSMGHYATQGWVRAYIDEVASTDLKTAKDTYEKFLNQRELMLREMGEERKTHHATAQSMAHRNEALRQKNKQLTELVEELFEKYTALTIKMTFLSEQIDDNKRKLHRAEILQCELEQQKRAAQSADDN